MPYRHRIPLFVLTLILDVNAAQAEPSFEKDLQPYLSLGRGHGADQLG